MKLIYSPSFNKDLIEIADYIAADNPRRAFSYAVEIRNKCRSLLIAPEGGRLRNDLRLGLRSIPHGSYVIFYSLSNAEIRIERVLHSARDIQTLFDN